MIDGKKNEPKKNEPEKTGTQTIAFQARMTPETHERMELVSNILGMNMSSLVKVLINDKYIHLLDNGMVDAYMRIMERARGGSKAKKESNEIV